MSVQGSHSVHWMKPRSRPLRRPTGAQSDVSVGVVVPVFNEAETLNYYLSRLYEVTPGRCAVVLVDGNSTDASVSIGRHFFHTETMGHPGRGGQLNHGARCLKTDVLQFLHADSELPPRFDFYIRQALLDRDVVGGCFRLEFDVQHPWLKAYSWFTRFSGRFFHLGIRDFPFARTYFGIWEGFLRRDFLRCGFSKAAEEIWKVRDTFHAGEDLGEKIHAPGNRAAATHQYCARCTVRTRSFGRTLSGGLPARALARERSCSENVREAVFQ